MRSVIGDTTQKISDAFHQASSAQRELNSTVVIQAEQAEKVEARTRVVANYNHSHALTILYYEVLQHHRVLTRPVSIRPVLLLKHEATHFAASVDGVWDYTLIELHAQTIGANLLDEALRDCLAVVKKLLCLRENFKPPPTFLPTDDYILNQFLLKIKTGASAAKRYVSAQLILKDGPPVPCSLLLAGSGPFTPPKLDTSFIQGVPPSDFVRTKRTGSTLSSGNRCAGGTLPKSNSGTERRPTRRLRERERILGISKTFMHARTQNLCTGSWLMARRHSRR